MLSLVVRSKTYPDRGGRAHVALRGLSLSVAAGEFVCLVGPSGCGKSTLLNIAGGLDRDFDGDARINGQPPGPGIGYMFQNPRLMPWLTVLDNVRLVLPDDAAATRRATDLLTALELGDVLTAYPGKLSGGMQRRVALARAFARSPRLLLMDEPFVSLDAPTASRLRQMLLDRQRDSGASVLFVTHDLTEALTLGDRVCFLSTTPGRIVHELRRSPATTDIAACRDALLRMHPQLLEGLTETGVAA